ncbi:MAG: Holliday junction resolvase RuvX [Eubacteriales bacterium]|nr:Holliday junction resolvase RuvX [Eubacteriales bacterium]
MKILGIDYGSKTIGLAIYDSSVDFYYPLRTLLRARENVLRKNINELSQIIVNECIEQIIIGLPLSMDGHIGERVFFVKEFAKKLSTKISDNIEIKFMDERLSTKEAKELLVKRGIKSNNIKEKIDGVAAIVILKDYLNNKNGEIYG